MMRLPFMGLIDRWFVFGEKNMKHCCIIGGAGFIGSHIVKKLISYRRQLTIIGRSPFPSRKLPDGVRYLSGDYGEKSFLTEALQDVDEIVHLAYSSVPKTSFENPLDDIYKNLPATVKLFEIASHLGVEKLLLVSSGGTVYGKAIKTPM